MQNPWISFYSDFEDLENGLCCSSWINRISSLLLHGTWNKELKCWQEGKRRQIVNAFSCPISCEQCSGGNTCNSNGVCPVNRFVVFDE